jgi:hypothetical protein
MSGCTVPSIMPAAAPASMALPPASRMRAAAWAASGWPAATIQRRPITWFMSPEAEPVPCFWLCTESRLMAAW